MNETDWPFEELNISGYNITSYRILVDTNGLFFIIWSEVSYIFNESCLYYCTFNGLEFSTKELIILYQNNTLQNQMGLYIYFDAQLDSNDVLHIIYYMLSISDIAYHIYKDSFWHVEVFPLEAPFSFRLISGVDGELHFIASLLNYPYLHTMNIIYMNYNGTHWFEPVLLTNYDYANHIAEYATICDVATNSKGEIFVLYQYQKRETITIDNILTTFETRYFIVDTIIHGYNIGTYSDNALTYEHIAYDEVDRLHLIYYGGLNEAGTAHTMNYTIYNKEKWSDIQSTTMQYNEENPLSTTFPYDLSIVGSDIFVPYLTIEETVNIYLMHSQGGAIWTILPVQTDDYNAIYPLLGANKNGSVVIAYVAQNSAENNLHVSYQNNFFTYRSTEVFSSISIVSAFLSLIACIPVIISLSKRTKK